MLFGHGRQEGSQPGSPLASMAGKAPAFRDPQRDRNMARSGLDLADESLQRLSVRFFQSITGTHAFPVTLVQTTLVPAGAGRELATGREKFIFASLAVAGITAETLVEIFSCCHAGFNRGRLLDTITNFQLIELFVQSSLVAATGKVN